MSEHNDTSWEDLFGSDDPRNYAVISSTGRTVDNCLTFGEAQGLVQQLDDEEKFEAFYAPD